LPLLDPAETQWLASALKLGPRIKHATLLKASGHRGQELAHRLLEQLLAHGWLDIEERRSRSTAPWAPLWVCWREWETACAERGIATPSRHEHDAMALLARPWTHPDLQALAEETALRGARAQTVSRIELLRALERWVVASRQGTWRDFSLHARGDTKMVTAAERQWLEARLDTPALGIEGHVPLLLLSGQFDSASSGHVSWRDATALGLPPVWWHRLRSAAWTGDSAFGGYLVVENRTSFDRLCASESAHRVVLWCPGYPPTYWRCAVSRLLDLMPGPARVFCDPDPAGVDIACRIGALWEQHALGWEPWRMDATALQGAAETKPLSAFDLTLLERLAEQPLPAALRALVAAMREGGCKAEQEGLV
jgi:hypothetical protein